MKTKKVSKLHFPQTYMRSSSKTIPFEYKNGFIIVNVVIDGRLPTKLIFDTGSKHTILTNNSLLPFLGREPEEQINLVGSDLSVVLTGRIMRRVTLQAGTVKIRSQSLLILDEDVLKLDELTGEKVYGILGTSSFGAYVVTIDYSNQELRLKSPSRFSPPRRASKIKVETASSKLYIKTPIQIHSSFKDSLNFLIDTGASMAMLLHATRKDSTIYPSRLTVGTIGTGLGGELHGYVGRSDSIRLGNFAIEDVVTHFQTVSDTTMLAYINNRQGIIGNKLLDRFLVVLDYPNSNLYLKPRRNFKKRKAFDKSGIKLVNDGENLFNHRIQFVREGSPAQLAGLEVGDRIIKFNGIPTRLLSLPSVNKKLRKRNGKRINLHVLRDGHELSFTFLLKDLI